MPGERCSADRLITALNAVGGVDGSDDIMAVDTALINTAFSKCGKVINAPFVAMGLEEGVEEEDVAATEEEEDDNDDGEEMEEELEEEEWREKEALGARIGARFGPDSDRVIITDFGYYLNEVDAEMANRLMPEAIPNHPLDNRGRVRQIVSEIPDDLKGRLRTHLKQLKATRDIVDCWIVAADILWLIV